MPETDNCIGKICTIIYRWEISNKYQTYFFSEKKKCLKNVNYNIDIFIWQIQNKLPPFQKKSTSGLTKNDQVDKEKKKSYYLLKLQNIVLV